MSSGYKTYTEYFYIFLLSYLPFQLTLDRPHQFFPGDENLRVVQCATANLYQLTANCGHLFATYSQQFSLVR